MKIVILGVCGAAMVGGWFLLNPYTPPNVYPVAPDAAYAELMAPVETQGGEGPFGTSGLYPSGNGTSEVHWDGGMKESGRRCTVLIAPFEGGRTQLNVTCPNAGEGAAAGLETNMRRNEVIELVDATMRARPYDKKLAMGGTAGKWPKDTVDHGNIFDAQSQALEMQAEMQRDLNEMEKARPSPKPPGW